MTISAKNVGKNQLGPWVKGSDTSRQAAIDNYPRSGTQRWKVFAHIACAGERGCTRNELEKKIGRSISSINPRVAELKEQNKIEPNGKTRTTPLGSQAEILVLTSEAIDELINDRDLYREMVEYVG